MLRILTKPGRWLNLLNGVQSDGTSGCLFHYLRRSLRTPLTRMRHQMPQFPDDVPLNVRNILSDHSMPVESLQQSPCLPLPPQSRSGKSDAYRKQQSKSPRSGTAFSRNDPNDVVP